MATHQHAPGSVSAKLAAQIGRQGLMELATKGDSLSLDDLPAVKLSESEMAALRGGHVIDDVLEFVNYWLNDENW